MPDNSENVVRRDEVRRDEEGRDVRDRAGIRFQGCWGLKKQTVNRSAKGFTLLEVLVALIIFGIITLALSNAMYVAMHAHVVAEQRQADTETMRGVFATLGRDLQSAYSSMYDPNALFVAGSGSGGSSSSNALLSFGTMTQRVITTDINVDPSINPSQSGGGSGNISSQNGSADPPQQPVALVRYDLDTQTGTLTRYAQAVPNVQTLQQATPGQQNVVASNIISLQLQFWDPNKQTWRTDWDYEQPNLPPPATAATTLNFPTAAASSTSSQGAASTSSTSATSTGTGTGDVGLPSAVQVTLVVRKSNGSQGTYTTILPILAPQIQDFPYTGGQNYDPTATPNSQTNLNSTTVGSSAGSSSMRH